MALRFGDRGGEVEELQTQLALAGFDPGEVDGAYGVRTTAAVRALQSSAGLRPDGIYGKQTAQALAELLSGGPDVPGTDPPLDEDPGHDESESDFSDLDARVVAIPTSFPDYFDNWGGALAARYRMPFFVHESSGTELEWKGRPTPVNLSSRTHVCMHITAVEFGTSARQRSRWADRIARQEISEEVVALYAQGSGDDQAVAERMALHERFWQVAYHWVALRNGDVLFNNPPHRYTYHGNRSNRFALGVAIEADLPGRERDRRDQHTPMDDHLVETGRAALRLAVSLGREQGAPLTHVTAHRCFSMTRASDPGEAVWREIVLPACDELDMTVDYALVDGGRHLPVDWDPGASHDWNDRELTP